MPPTCLSGHVGASHGIYVLIGDGAGCCVSSMTPFLQRLFDEDSCEHYLEYTLIAILVALAAFIAVHGLGNVISSELNTVANSF